jgi:squalene-hopene/tetraprenyl-beta-curcumene cyclase
MMTLLLCVFVQGMGEKPKPEAQQDDLGKRLREGYSAAADWLVKTQGEDGGWKAGMPGKEMTSLAYTGLIVSALAGAPDDVKAAYKGAITKGAALLASKQNADGSFGEGPSGAFLKTYVTGIAMMALGAVDRDKYKDQLGNARGYLKANQLKEGPDRGGLGYGDKEPKPDGKIKEGIANLSTLGFGAEGMKAAGLPADDEFWKLCVEYEVNKDEKFLAALKEKGLSIGDDGGLFYTATANRDDHKAGTVKIGDKEIIQSYGSMTYDGIKTYLFSGLSKDSKEVKSAMDWVRKNYTVDIHPGFPSDAQKRELSGVYYYYLLMSRALDAYGERPLKGLDGKEHDWVKDIGEKLLQLSKNGKWVNENTRWWEGDPMLVTTYVLNTMNVLLKNTK